jgi:F0F1-type ATP synthase assembly protein I
MPADDPESQRNAPPGRSSPASIQQQFAIALELPFVLVTSVIVGGAFGYLLDRWLHTKPFGMLILGALGFFAGVREIVKRTGKGSDGGKSGSAR